MNALNKNLLRATAGVGASALALLSAPIALGAADDDVVVTNTETVQVYMDADGDIDTQRVYEQLVLTGTGDVSVENPIETDGLRNLDGFSGYDIEDGKAVLDESVDGEERFRSVSDFDGELPLDVSIAYFLDGDEVEAGDVVGEDGELEVVYHVENTTAETQTVEVADGKGGTVAKEVDVVLPMVGSLSTVLPSNFTDVESAQANMAGDGRGGTKMSFTMTLFPPIGSPVAEFGYTATITDGVVPDATISALPVNPLEAASFKGGAASYKGGADTGAELTAGATEIDANLLKLRDGAADLSLGLIKLYNGASQLEEGLNTEAVPGAEQLYDGSIRLVDGTDQLEAGTVDLQDGAEQLADGTTRLEDGANRLNEGAEDLSEGTTQLEDGAQRLDDGASRLSDGASDLSDGASDLNDGAARLDGGAAQLDEGAEELHDGIGLILRGVKNLPKKLAKDPDFQRLKGTLTKIQAGIGDPDDMTQQTLLGGLNLLEFGLRNPAAAADCLAAQGGSPADDCGAADAVEFISEKLSAGSAKITNQLIPAAQATYQFLQPHYGCPALENGQPRFDLIAPGTPCFYAAVSLYGYSAPADAPAPFDGGGLAYQSTLAAQALTQVYQGLDSRAIPGIRAIKKALYNAPCDPAQTDPNAANFCGISQALGLVNAGVDTLVQSISAELTGALTQAYEGAGRLEAGTSDLAAGTEQLLGGTTRLEDGATQLSDGATTLSGGAMELFNGTEQLDDGALQLFNGTDDLLDGATQLDDGAEQLADGSVRLNDGASDLSDGSGDLSDGLERLYQGLLTAGDGTSQLRDGLQQAKEGAPKIESGASQLSEQGTQKLVEAGSDTAVTFGEGYAMLTAGAERAETESMAFGAPEGAQGVTAYTYEIRGADGESSRNWTRGLGALAILAAGTGIVMWRRSLS